MHHTGPIETIVSGGTFGLPTNGHKDMWWKAARSAKKLVIVIANNPGEKPDFFEQGDIRDGHGDRCRYSQCRSPGYEE